MNDFEFVEMFDSRIAHAGLKVWLTNAEYFRLLSLVGVPTLSDSSIKQAEGHYAYSISLPVAREALRTAEAFVAQTIVAVLLQ